MSMERGVYMRAPAEIKVELAEMAGKAHWRPVREVRRTLSPSLPPRTGKDTKSRARMAREHDDARRSDTLYPTACSHTHTHGRRQRTKKRPPREVACSVLTHPPTRRTPAHETSEYLHTHPTVHPHTRSWPSPMPNLRSLRNSWLCIRSSALNTSKLSCTRAKMCAQAR